MDVELPMDFEEYWRQECEWQQAVKGFDELNRDLSCVGPIGRMLHEATKALPPGDLPNQHIEVLLEHPCPGSLSIRLCGTTPEGRMAVESLAPKQ